jgi:hypothetical protein
MDEKFPLSGYTVITVHNKYSHQNHDIYFTQVVPVYKHHAPSSIVVHSVDGLDQTPITCHFRLFIISYVRFYPAKILEAMSPTW